MTTLLLHSGNNLHTYYTDVAENLDRFSFWAQNYPRICI
jgi:hypothetical protein